MRNSNEKRCVRTADVIATLNGKIVLIVRQKFPFGFALPGGHVENGERPSHAAKREFTEETGLTLGQMRFVLSHRGKHRDPRYEMSQTRVYAGNAEGNPRDEAGFTKVVLLSGEEIVALKEEQFAFDHHKILMQFLSAKVNET